jgi:hypothetical protein
MGSVGDSDGSVLLLLSLDVDGWQRATEATQ